jgi:hypothetical protein
MVNLEDVFAEADKNGRVCPLPMKWNELYELLPVKKRIGNGWEPSLPLILAAWQDTPIISKKLRLKEHLEWAANHGCLDIVYNFLLKLREEDWFHDN